MKELSVLSLVLFGYHLEHGLLLGCRPRLVHLLMVARNTERGLLRLPFGLHLAAKVGCLLERWWSLDSGHLVLWGGCLDSCSTRCSSLSVGLDLLTLVESHDVLSLLGLDLLIIQLLELVHCQGDYLVSILLRLSDNRIPLSLQVL